jgi:predicted ribosomally synthesized peptide with nif11-like leader
MDYKGISPELREKAKACTSPEEMLELAKREGYKLSDEEIEAVSGGHRADWQYELAENKGGDPREGVDPALAHEDFANGAVDGGEDW